MGLPLYGSPDSVYSGFKPSSMWTNPLSSTGPLISNSAIKAFKAEQRERQCHRGHNWAGFSGKSSFCKLNRASTSLLRSEGQQRPCLVVEGTQARSGSGPKGRVAIELDGSEVWEGSHIYVKGDKGRPGRLYSMYYDREVRYGVSNLENGSDVTRASTENEVVGRRSLVRGPGKTRRVVRTVRPGKHWCIDIREVV